MASGKPLTHHQPCHNLPWCSVKLCQRVGLGERSDAQLRTITFFGERFPGLAGGETRATGWREIHCCPYAVGTKKRRFPGASWL